MSLIVSPHVNPEAAAMDATAKTLLFLMLKKNLPGNMTDVEKSVEKLKFYTSLMYKSGLTDAWEHWGDFAKSKINFFGNVQTLVEELNKWEAQYLTWMKGIHGEEAVKQKLAEAMKGLNND